MPSPICSSFSKQSTLREPHDGASSRLSWPGAATAMAAGTRGERGGEGTGGDALRSGCGDMGCNPGLFWIIWARRASTFFCCTPSFVFQKKKVYLKKIVFQNKASNEIKKIVQLEGNFLHPDKHSCCSYERCANTTRNLEVKQA